MSADVSRGRDLTRHSVAFHPPEEDPRPENPPIEPIELADFTATRRMVSIAFIAIAIGIVATYVASARLQRIARRGPARSYCLLWPAGGG
jgi:hypothetical protein